MNRTAFIMTVLGLINAVPAGAQRLPLSSRRLSTDPTPAITLVSVSQGSPGDRVVISGVGFGTQQGSVTFSVEPKSEVGAPISGWSDTSIEVKVPDVSGMMVTYAGELKVHGPTTLSAPFRFIPALETITLTPEAGDIVLVEPFGWNVNVCHPACASGPNLNMVVGAKGEDEFYRGKGLLNGWTVKSVSLAYVSPSGQLGKMWIQNRASASVVDQRVGTKDLYVKVGWWYDAFGGVAYVPQIVIQGPKGVPYK